MIDNILTRKKPEFDYLRGALWLYWPSAFSDCHIQLKNFRKQWRYKNIFWVDEKNSQIVWRKFFRFIGAA